MSVKFKTVAHKNLQDLAAPAKHYALVEPTGTTDIDGLSAMIASLVGSKGFTFRKVKPFASTTGIYQSYVAHL